MVNSTYAIIHDQFKTIDIVYGKQYIGYNTRSVQTIDIVYGKQYIGYNTRSV